MNPHNEGSVFAIVSVLLFVSIQNTLAKPVKNDKCEYDLDLVGNNIRIVCQGKSAKVNIYASNAEIYDTEIVTPVVRERKPMQPQRDSVRAKPSIEDFRFENPKSQSLWNVTKKMERLKRKLSRHSIMMSNISSLLATGDGTLRADLELMRRMQYDSVKLKDAMLAAIQNQYNFMRTAILTQNAELSKMMDTLQLMVDVTSRSLQSSARSELDLVSQIGVVNQTMVNMRRMLSRELKRKRRRHNGHKNESAGECPQQVVAFASGDVINVKGKRGTFMKDATSDIGTIYVMQGAGSTDRLAEYESEIDLEYSYSSITFNLPFKCQGTGHVVYRGCLYCQIEGTTKIIKYKLGRMETLGQMEILPVTHPELIGPRRYEYADSNIDLSVDELGLWVIYTTPESAGKIMISKINDAILEIENTWLTSYPKSMAKNTFMICGILHTVGSFAETPTYIKYLFNTHTGKDTLLKDGTLVLPALDDDHVELAMLDYHYKDRALYGWGGAKVYTFHVYLDDGIEL